MPILNPTPKMIELLYEPALTVAGFGVEDTVVTDTVTFLRDLDDANSDLVLSRERALDAAGNLIRSEAWTLANDPFITSVVTDQTDDATVALVGETEFTIVGRTFGAVQGDVGVVCYFTPKLSMGGRHPFAKENEGRLAAHATITAVANLDDADPDTATITATVTLPHEYGGKDAGVGSFSIEVVNVTRRMKSERFTGLSVV